jgi:hypothetical protein
VWVRPASRSVVQGTVTVRSDQLSGSPAIAWFDEPLADVTPGEPAEPATFDGEYTGTLTYLGPARFTIDWELYRQSGAGTGQSVPVETLLRIFPPMVATASSGGLQRIPIRAWATEQNGARVVDFYDPTRLLSSNGKLRASNSDYSLVDWLAPSDLEAGTGRDATGLYMAQTFLWSSHFDVDAKTLRGTIWLDVPGAGHPFVYRYDLAWTSLLASCNEGCADGSACNEINGQSVCETGPQWTPATGSPFALRSERFTAWLAWLNDLDSRAESLDTAMCVGTCGDERGPDEAISYLCYDPGANPRNDLAFGAPLPVSGDLQCSTGRIPRGVDAVYSGDRSAATGDSVSTQEMFSSCINELRTAAPLLSEAYSDDVEGLRRRFADTFKDSDCFSAPNFYGSLGRITGGVSNDEEQRQRYLLVRRLVTQWLSVHGFLAKEGLQSSRIAIATSAADDLEPAEAAAARHAPSLEQLLAQMERGWNLVHDDRLSYHQVVTPTAQQSYWDNDYRPAGAPDGDQKVPLPVTLLETAGLHLDVLVAYLRDAQHAAYDECRLAGISSIAAATRATASRTLRYALLAEVKARQYYERTVHRYPVDLDEPGGFEALEGVCDSFGGHMFFAPLCFIDGRLSTDVEPPWQARWDAAVVQYEAAMQRALTATTDLADCKSPLDLPERAVPLYFGDVSGNSSRFFAASDYLLNGWAKPAVEQASSALSAARGAWAQKRDSATQEVLTLQEADRRRERLASEYGQQVIDLCGLEGVPAKDVLSQFEGLPRDVAGECYVKLDAAECDQFVNHATSGSISVSAAPRALATLSLQESSQAPRCDDESEDTSCNPESTCGGGTTDDFSVKVQMCVFNDVWRLDPERTLTQHVKRAAEAYRSAEFDFDDCAQISHVRAGGERVDVDEFSKTHGFVSYARLEQASAYCADEMAGRYQKPYVPDLTSHAACFRGQLGEEVLGLMGARQDIELARAEWADAQALYDISAKHCDRMEEWNISLETLTRDHEESMKDWEIARGLTDIAIQAIGSYYTADVQGGIGVVRSSVGMVFANHIGAADRAYQRKMRAIERERGLYDCYAEGRKVKLRIDNAARAIERAITEADRHLVKFGSMQVALRNVIADGNAALVREQGRVVPPLAFHYWLDERIDRFHKDFQWAKSLTYLAMTAVEYEYQQSMGTRDDIMTAVHPDQLLDAIRQMEQTQISRTINGRRPEDAKVVRSLAQDILQLTALAPSRAGERTLTALQRFQQRLWSPAYAMYDADGVYIGQGIPFSLEPQGELIDACAERVWAVTATIQGDTLTEAEPSVPLTVLKRNHFTSQWCEGKDDGTGLQTSTVQPVSRLFHPEDRGGDEAEVSHFTSARVWPWFNVPRSEFYRDTYGEGASTEIAGQGLYGDYVLLFPANGLLREGFPLEKVEDVLLRFDYLSVDDLQATPRTLTAESRE